jgi:PhoH-like ATPase
MELLEIEVQPSLINTLYKNKTAPLITGDEEGYCVLRAGQQSALAVVQDSQFCLLPKAKEYRGVSPKDAAQTCFYDALERYALTVCLGLAGSGKTFMSLAYAVHQAFRNDMKIVLIKPTHLIGGKSNAIAAVKGDVREKLAPYIASYEAHLNTLLGEYSSHQLFQWEEDGVLEFTAVELVRGRHFEKSIVIVDEAQNLSQHELLSLISRVADSSRLLLLGDPQQIDTGARWKTTGLGKLLDTDAFFESPFVGGIKLTHTYRGCLAEFASDVLYELDYEPPEPPSPFSFLDTID